MARFSGCKFYTLKVRLLFMITIKQCKCVNIRTMCHFLLKLTECVRFQKFQSKIILDVCKFCTFTHCHKFYKTTSRDKYHSAEFLSTKMIFLMFCLKIHGKGLFINDVITFGGYPDPPPPPQVMTSFMNSPLQPKPLNLWG